MKFAMLLCFGFACVFVVLRSATEHQVEVLQLAAMILILFQLERFEWRGNA